MLIAGLSHSLMQGKIAPIKDVHVKREKRESSTFGQEQIHDKRSLKVSGWKGRLEI